MTNLVPDLVNVPHYKSTFSASIPRLKSFLVSIGYITILYADG